MTPAVRQTPLVVFLLILVACASRVEEPAPLRGSESPERRAILVSFDSFSERRALETLEPVNVPEILALFRESTCADYAIPHFPSVTASGHAAIWTGAFGDVNGVAANTQSQLPRDRFTIMQVTSGYSHRALRAEPIWISAGGAELRVVAHHPTQAPHAPGYPASDGAPGAELLDARTRAEAALAAPNVHVVNGYNITIANDTVITERVAPPRRLGQWRNLERLGRTVAPREIAWAVGSGGDSVFALLYGERLYDRILVASSRDAGRGVTAAAAPVEREWPRGRALARHFSEGVEYPSDSGSVFLRVRLFELAPDASSFLILQPRLQIAEGNRRDVGRSYDAAVRGWVGNGASRVYDRGELGPPIEEGGDGTAELRFLESQELVTRQFMRGSEWGWSEMGAELLTDYFPLGDETDHRWFGLVDRSTPKYDPKIGEPLREMRERSWQLVDLRLGHLRELVSRSVAAGEEAALFVTGDHGMRSTWRIFRPNAALREAGLLELDTAGRVDPARSRAVAPTGYFVSLNRTAWRSGTVSPADEARVLAEAERALLAARTPEGTPIVTRIFRASADDSLGLGGPVGGDLYFETAPGYRWTWRGDGPVSEEGALDAGHGFASTAPDMHTVFCAYGPAFAPRRIPGMLVIHAAPTVSEWLGASPPAHARGRSVLSDLLRPRSGR
jgi:hypothetical protein